MINIKSLSPGAYTAIFSGAGQRRLYRGRFVVIN
jgi:hypothetical protein